MISVVVPALDEEALLPACLTSLNRQKCTEKREIIVADNGSSDASASIARQLGAFVVHCAEKEGVFFARQIGARFAHGDILVQADADTLYPEDWLATIADYFACLPEAVALTGRFHYIDPPFWAPLEYSLRDQINRFTVALVGMPTLVSGATFAFRTQAFHAVNGYAGIRFPADQCGLVRRLSRVGDVVYARDLCVLTSARTPRKPLSASKTVLENLKADLHRANTNGRS
ncbi:MAG: glycosyltransferase family 2 protein [Chloroflexota bacterium]